MEILYITTLWKGFDDLMLEGSSPGHGLPAFWEPLNLMLNIGWSLKYVTIEGDSTYFREFNIGDPRIKRSDVLERVHYGKKIVGKIKGRINIQKATKTALQKNKFDFVYLHGGTAGLVSTYIRKSGIPVGQRLYGTFLYHDIKRWGVFTSRILRNNEFNSFTSEKNFLITTNDGSQGDKVVSLLNKNKPPFEFYYWINGVHSNAPVQATTESIAATEPFIFYCARFDRWKRQDKAVRLLYQLLALGININLVFAGEDQGPYAEYKSEIKKLCAELGVNAKVHYLGHIPREVTQNLHHKAVASLFFYDVCNLGNSLHEAVAAGGAVITLTDPSLEDYIIEGINGFVAENEEDAISIIRRLYEDTKIRKEITETSIAWSKKHILSWAERAQLEIDLIKKTSKRI